ncbi:hypothetical protein LIER_29203 [Lithospermum erythrorhizon]|uniref:GCK domain-containing protein n=1 Tax=Lithospermum erythrorhizon TaxID=34254 RepID=A0AAV3RM12_LITER
MKTTINFSVWNKLKLIAEGERERKIEDILVFYKFMRDGKCREEFNGVLKCSEQFQDIKEFESSKCDDEYMALSKCCKAHKDYYWPILTKDMQVSNAFFEQLKIKHRKEREQILEDLKRN